MGYLPLPSRVERQLELRTDPQFSLQASTVGSNEEPIRQKAGILIELMKVAWGRLVSCLILVYIYSNVDSLIQNVRKVVKSCIYILYKVSELV